MPFDLSQSFAKNAGLYGERVGALHVPGADRDAADRIRSQLSVLQRSEISNPPAHGARLVCIPGQLLYGANPGIDRADLKQPRAIRGMEARYQDDGT